MIDSDNLKKCLDAPGLCSYLELDCAMIDLDKFLDDFREMLDILKMEYMISEGNLEYQIKRLENYTIKE